MEDKKKTFGAYILQRRKELGMTQKAFAEKLYVTESAVSKWERGLSYPDITLLGTICEVLGVTEHELLTGSEDTQKRSAERLAEKYLRLTRNYRRAQYIIYGLLLLGFLVGSLVSGNPVYFFIALPSVIMAASLTLLPALLSEHPTFGHYRASLSIGGFTAALELLLLCYCMLEGESWFPTVGISVLFGMTLVFLPFLMRQIPFPDWMEGRRASAYLLLETALLLVLLLVCCFQTGGDWFPVAAASVIFGLGFPILPVLLRQLPLPIWMQGRRTSAYLLIETALLLLLLFVCWLQSGGDWFLVAAVSVVFGLGFLILPVLLRQLPLPEGAQNHKALIYFAVQTALLFALLLVAERHGSLAHLLAVDLPVAGFCLLLPWGVMLIVRYLPVSGWFRGGLSALWTALWAWLSPFAIDLPISNYYGYGLPEFGPLSIPFDFRATNPSTQGWNAFVIVLLSMVGIAAALFAVGLIRRKK